MGCVQRRYDCTGRDRSTEVARMIRIPCNMSETTSAVHRNGHRVDRVPNEKKSKPIHPDQESVPLLVLHGEAGVGGMEAPVLRGARGQMREHPYGPPAHVVSADEQHQALPHGTGEQGLDAGCEARV